MGVKFNPLTGKLDEYGPVLTGTGTVAAASDGTAALPGIAFASDLNTGIYRPGADQLAISTNGTGRLFVDSKGIANFVGDTEALLPTDGYSQVIIKNDNASSNYASINFKLVDDTSIERHAGSIALLRDGTWTGGSGSYPANLIFSTRGSSGSQQERLRLTSDGKLGLGTSSPGQKLDVADGDIRLRKTTGGDTSGVTSPVLRIGTQSGDLACFYAISSGAGGPGGRGGDLYIQTKANNGSPTDRLVITEGGLVGIGTTAPTQKLHVQAGYLLLNSSEPNGSGNARLLINQGSRQYTFYPYSNNTNSTVDLRLSTPGASNQITITDAGLVGIGTASPSSLLTLRQTAASHQIIEISRPNSDTGALYLGNDTNNNAVIAANNSDILFGTDVSGTFTEKARIDSAGRLLVGTSSARESSSVIETESNSLIYQSFVGTVNSNSNPIYGPHIFLNRSRGTANGSSTVVNNGDTLGAVIYRGADGSAFKTAARIDAEVDGTPGANDMPGRLVFSTTADGASSPTERMRITQEGNITIGSAGTAVAASSGTADGVTIYGASGVTISRNNANAISLRRRLGDGNIAAFYRDTTVVGTISVTTTATAYNTSSDYRLKENVVPLTGAVDRLNQLQVHRFNFIADPETTVDGFIAHEAQAVVPECVTGTKDEVDENGDPVYQGIDQSKLVPLLTAALQEALAEIESLKARVTALEP